MYPSAVLGHSTAQQTALTWLRNLYYTLINFAEKSLIHECLEHHCTDNIREDPTEHPWKGKLGCRHSPLGTISEIASWRLDVECVLAATHVMSERRPRPWHFRVSTTVAVATLKLNEWDHFKRHTGADNNPAPSWGNHTTWVFTSLKKQHVVRWKSPFFAVPRWVLAFYLNYLITT